MSPGQAGDGGKLATFDRKLVAAAVPTGVEVLVIPWASPHAILKMLSGLNHLTLAVTDLERSLGFFCALLGFRVRARWDGGAYLSLGDLWLCLSRSGNESGAGPGRDYTHYAFSIRTEDFELFSKALREARVQEWRDNSSEGASIYFLDPDGHQLEVHVGTLDTRLAECKARPYSGMLFYD